MKRPKPAIQRHDERRLRSAFMRMGRRCRRRRIVVMRRLIRVVRAAAWSYEVLANALSERWRGDDMERTM
jgi:hypothetical protein